MSHAIQHVDFVLSNLFQQQHSKLIKPTKHLKSTIESTAKAASLFIYLLEWYICNIQYFGKSETQFNIRLNNHGKGVKNPNAISAWLANISTGTIMTLTIMEILFIIKQLRNICTTSTETLEERIKQEENFWIMKLETLVPLGLNQDLN